MKIIEILDKDCIIPELQSQTKRDVIYELVNALAKKDSLIDPDTLMEILLEREKLGSTGIGEGVAIPHGKVPKINNIRLSFGRSLKGVDFEAIDGKPSHLFFLLVAPESSSGAHLKALARISRLLKDGSFRENLLSARTTDEIFNIIAQEDSKF
jgi:PTS system nitrogen regulatory IIA component